VFGSDRLKQLVYWLSRSIAYAPNDIGGRVQTA